MLDISFTVDAVIEWLENSCDPVPVNIRYVKTTARPQPGGRRGQVAFQVEMQQPLWVDGELLCTLAAQSLDLREWTLFVEAVQELAAECPAADPFCVLGSAMVLDTLNIDLLFAVDLIDHSGKKVFCASGERDLVWLTVNSGNCISSRRVCDYTTDAAR